MNYLAQISLCAIAIVLVNALAIVYTLDERKEAKYLCISGNYKGQTHTLKDWRKIAIELAKTVKSTKLNAQAKHGTDEDIIGLLYINFGVELVDI